ncbi:hypothetical protein OYC64_009258 [Pagothenia borchgrevinki]|uniref:Uncharacterized protein n=1 Tax=Pagothenia borchgrevinki TaxID=8213 RepID=A0ABD2H4M7_PAGBO
MTGGLMMLSGSEQPLLRMLHDRYHASLHLGLPVLRRKGSSHIHTDSKITTNRARTTEWERKRATGLEGSVNDCLLLSASLAPVYQGIDR